MLKDQTDYLLTTFTKINTKWIKDLYVSLEIIKLLEENIGSVLFDIGLCNIFLDLSPQARETKTKINTWDFIKTKKLLYSEGNYQQNEKATH